MPFFLKTLYGGFVSDVITIGSGAAGNEGRTREDLFRVFYASAGAELRSDWTFFFYLPSQVRLGVYHGFGPVGEAVYGALGFEAAL